MRKPRYAFASRVCTHHAFTIIEMMVVCFVIAILIALLVPTIIHARKSAQLTACSATLQQLGVAFAHYAAANDGYWPMDSHNYNASPSRTRCWYDMISGYVGKPINMDGDHVDEVNGDGSAQNLLRACPVWNLDHREPAYAMNPFPYAEFRKPRIPTVGGRQGWIRCLAIDYPSYNGWYVKASNWNHPATRCLLVESMSPQLGVSGWPWWVGGGPMPRSPDAGDFSCDYTRHKTSAGQVINMLFCDGHVGAVTPYEAFQAIAEPK